MQHHVDAARALKGTIDQIQSTIRREDKSDPFARFHAIESIQEDGLIVRLFDGLAVAQREVHIVKENNSGRFDGKELLNGLFGFAAAACGGVSVGRDQPPFPISLPTFSPKPPTCRSLAIAGGT